MLWALLSYTYIAIASPKCYTEIDIRVRICWAICRHDGSDSGTYVPKTGKCRCGTDRDFNDLVDPKIEILTPRMEGYYDSDTGLGNFFAYDGSGLADLHSGVVSRLSWSKAEK